MKDNNTITEFKLYFDLDKELAYINEMNQKGWKLVYIKGGCFYTFVKTAPDEYITIMHTETKQRLSEVTAFAAQCGYESIPHTMDGFGEVMYLTGKKSEVSAEFISDIPQQVESQKRLCKKFFILTVIYYILLAILLLESAVCYAVPLLAGETNPFFVGICVFFFLLTLVFLCMTVSITLITVKMKKKLKTLRAESAIYE